MSKFTGFPKETLSFLRALRRNNTKAWFDKHRDEYRDVYVEPAKRFAQAAGERLRTLRPEIQAEPRINGSIFRINRDTRFSRDKTPYKDHLDFFFWEGERKTAASGFFVRIAPEQVGVGVGSHGFDPVRLAAFRRAICDDEKGRELAMIARKIRRTGYEMARERYKRVPKGFDSDGPAAGFLLFDALHVHTEEAADSRLQCAKILTSCMGHWRRLAPLHNWIIDHVQTAP